MGGVRKWFKSLNFLKKDRKIDQENVGSKGRKWRVWRSTSGSKLGRIAASPESSDCGSSGGAPTTVAQVPAREAWAAIRIQTVFRAFLARRALRALRSIVRLQAIFRGRKVRRQAAITLRCMQALARVQAQVIASSVQRPRQGQAGKNKANLIRQAESAWCGSPGTVEEVRAKLQKKQEGAIKRERAISYSLSQQQMRRSSSLDSRTSKQGKSSNSGWSWLDSWIASNPWESRLMEELRTYPSEITPTSAKNENRYTGSYSSLHELSSIKLKWKSEKGQYTNWSADQHSEWLYNESTSSSPSFSNLESPGSSNSDRESTTARPNYMNLTESTKAKQRQLMESFQLHKKKMQLFRGDSWINLGSDLYTSTLCKDLYPAMHLERYDWEKS
ncbi:hypothetical protein NMG60_11004112 [Bertholletia excelsa]